MLLRLVSSPICNVIFVIFTQTSDSRLMMRDCRQTSGKDFLMLLHLEFSPICNVILVIFKQTSDSRLMRRDCRQG